MVDAGDLDFRAAHALGDDVRRFRDDQFARAGDTAGRAEFRVFREQIFHTVEDEQRHALGGGRIMFGDVST